MTAHDEAIAAKDAEITRPNHLPVEGCIHCRPGRLCTYHKPENNVPSTPASTPPTVEAKIEQAVEVIDAALAQPKGAA